MRGKYGGRLWLVRNHNVGGISVGKPVEETVER